MKNSEIARAFFYGEVASNSNKSFYVEVVEGVSIAFSYGGHFPIAIQFNDGYFFNSSGYSVTTSRHKNLILNEIKNELSDSDYKNTSEMLKIVDLIKYEGVRTKAEIIEKAI